MSAQSVPHNHFPCEVCGGRQETNEFDEVLWSEHDQRFHKLLERIEALEARLAVNDDHNSSDS